MSKSAHFIVEKGTRQGDALLVPPDGARIGRSSKNDIVIDDAMMSRHHCRAFFRDGALWISDLGSANETLVNDVPVQELQLKTGDHVLLGDTRLRVVSASATPSETAPGGDVDLGLGNKPARTAARKRIGTGPLVTVAVIVILLAAAAWIPRLMPSAQPPPPAPPMPEPDPTLAVDYEKVQAGPDNIFRYHLGISDRNVISIEIDDLANNRHVRKEKAVDPALIDDLIDTIDASGFYGLDAVYRGIQNGAHDEWNLTVTIGQRTHTCRVLNRVEPELFKAVRETLEEFGKNELGLWAIEFSAEKLREMAHTAYLQGRKLYDEREIQFGNLAGAMKHYAEAEWYLETVEPKPDFYPEVITGIEDCKALLQEKYETQNFRAERAIKLREWEQAAQELRILCEMIPDRSDARHQDARRKLLDVERRIEVRK
jgi:pSer/pThr/pTyr-binding forkhead associated (FHA) protein